MASAGGAEVTVFDARPSVGRKFLVAGRGGLNLTHDEPPGEFSRRYTGPDQPDGFWSSVLTDFDPEALRAWAKDLGVETFTAKTGRVYPVEMKAAPLLRRWVHRLREAGVRFALNHRWTGLTPGTPWRVSFESGGEAKTFESDAVILALGGGSWPDTGSDGTWTTSLESLGVTISPLAPANCGWELPWPAAVLELAEGKPLKNVTVRAGDITAVGELLITKYGLEGGTIYTLGATLRSMQEPEIIIDFKPAHTVDQLVRKLGNCPRNFLQEARSRWKLSDAAFVILSHLPGEALFSSAEATAATIKACKLRLTGPRP
ncbi:MAG TPA: TIGR03862 family flavoprotein, partial [Roseimicrobium sp.]|nr:TIGR03862 family flavoprotein [Roseimicrobium sp.]